MKRIRKFNSPAEGVKEQQVEKKVNVFTPTKKNNSKITINDLDTRLGIIDKLLNSSRDFKPYNSSDRHFLSLNVSKLSVNKGGESSNTDRGKGNIENSNAETAITKSDDIANARKVAAFVRKVLHNELPIEKREWPLCLLIESKQSVKISHQEFQNMIIDKSAEVMATKSRFSKQMVDISICKEHQRSYYKKYKQLLNDINTMSAELDCLNRMPSTTVKHVRNVGTNVSMIPNYNHDKKVFTTDTKPRNH